MALQDDYQVRLDSFQGPLDLLLFLIRRAEVEITDIPIHRITEQYFLFLKQLQNDIDIDLAGEFLVMAATLVEIKSRTLAPAQKRSGEAGEASPLDDSDPRFELVQQLLSYQKYRTAADDLQQLRSEFAQRYPVGGRGAAEGEEPEREYEIEDVHLLDLIDAYERIIAGIDLTVMGGHTVEYDDTPISLHQVDLVDRLQNAPAKRMTLQEIFAGRSRGEAIGLFLAMLELAREQRIGIRQDKINGTIDIELELGNQLGAGVQVKT